MIQLSNSIERLHEKLIYAYIFTVPIVVYGFSIAGISINLSRLVLFLSIPTVGTLLLRRLEKIKSDNFLIYALIPFVIYSLISLMWTPVDRKAFGFSRFLGLCEIIFIYLSFLVMNIDLNKIKVLFKVFVMSAFVPLLFGLWQLANNVFLFSKAQLPFQEFFISGKFEMFKNRELYFLDGNLTRISSVFAEPTVFGLFLATALLITLEINPFIIKKKMMIRFLQLALFVFLILTLSKLGILTFFVGLILIGRKNIKKTIGIVAIVVSVGISFLFIMNFFSTSSFISKRFLTGSGHLLLITNTFKEVMNVDLFFGEGVGGIPRFTTNKFLLSRAYETGIIGVAFTAIITYLPIHFRNISKLAHENESIGDLCFVLMVTTIFSFHLYDNFIYPAPWIVIGIINSYCLEIVDKKQKYDLSKKSTSLI